MDKHGSVPAGREALWASPHGKWAELQVNPILLIEVNGVVRCIQRLYRPYALIYFFEDESLRVSQAFNQPDVPKVLIRNPESSKPLCGAAVRP